MQHFIKMFNKKHSKDMTKDKRSLQKLRREVEKAKRALSSTHQARVEIEALYDGVDLSETLTRAHFEEINADLFKNTLGPVKQVLEDSGLKKNQIDEIVLVGGSTRVPKIQQPSRTSSMARNLTGASILMRPLHMGPPCRQVFSRRGRSGSSPSGRDPADAWH